MKTIKNALFALFFGWAFICSSQEKPKKTETKLTINDVYNESTLGFYGFDFSNFRLVQPDKLNDAEDIKDNLFPEWNAFVLQEFSMNKLAKWFKKTAFYYNPVPVTILNSKVSESDVVARLPFKTELSEIQKSIQKYEKPLNPKYKIGMVINVEYFEKKTKEASAYLTFFEVSTGTIIISERLTNKEAYGEGYTKYWGKSLAYIIKDYYDNIYKKGL